MDSSTVPILFIFLLCFLRLLLPLFGFFFSLVLIHFLLRFAAVNMEYQITTITQSINLTPNCKFALVLLCMHHQFITNSPFLFSSPQTATRYAATGHDDLVIIIISTAAAAAKPSLLPLYCSLAKNPWPWPPESTEEVVVARSTPVGIGTGSRHEADA
uniref:Uncharacterized protein n=1 Tax=Oryza rufipogon TaxID=4529 RepID=A0A0E0QI01_ORYRU